MADVFISYAREDRHVAERLAAVLAAKGWVVFWDRRIPAGRRFDEYIGQQLQAARCVVALWSSAVSDSDWVMEEADDARERKILVPARIQAVTPPLGFRRIHAADLIGWSGEEDHEGLQQLLEDLASRLRPDATGRDTAKAISPPEKPGASVTPVVLPRPDPPQRPPVSNRPVLPPIRPGPIRPGAPQRPPVSNRPALPPIAPPLSAEALRPPLVPRIPRPSAASARTGNTLRNEESPQPGETRIHPADGLAYVWIPPGKFEMGASPDDKEAYGDEKPRHTVEITSGFWIGQTPVTQAAYEKVIGKNPSRFKGTDRPVECVSWDEARRYCEAVGGRLPTEAEWEYAARAGSEAARYGELDAIAWFDDNSGGQTRPVKSKEPNAWGLYDTLGNVGEWVADWYGEDYYASLPSPAADPKGPDAGELRVLRGGVLGQPFVGPPRIVPGEVRAGLPVQQLRFPLHAGRAPLILSRHSHAARPGRQCRPLALQWT